MDFPFIFADTKGVDFAVASFHNEKTSEVLFKQLLISAVAYQVEHNLQQSIMDI